MSVHLVFGNIKGGHPVLNSEFSSVTLADGITHTLTETGYNYVSMLADAKTYVAFTTDDSEPDAAADPRFLLPADTPVQFYIKAGTKIKTAAYVAPV